MSGAIEAVTGEGVPKQFVSALKEGFDCTLDFFGRAVPEWACYLVLAAVTAILIGGYVALCAAHKKRR